MCSEQYIPLDSRKGMEQERKPSDLCTISTSVYLSGFHAQDQHPGTQVHILTVRTTPDIHPCTMTVAEWGQPRTAHPTDPYNIAEPCAVFQARGGPAPVDDRGLGGAQDAGRREGTSLVAQVRAGSRRRHLVELHRRRACIVVSVSAVSDMPRCAIVIVGRRGC